MIYIKKGQEPKSLTEYKKKIGASYADVDKDCKDDLRKIYHYYRSRDEKDNLKEYSGIVLWYLENRLK